MPKAEGLQTIQYGVLCALAFAIPLPFIYGSILSVALVAVWLFASDKREVVHNLKTNKALWLWPAFYLLHIISYIFSEDKQASLFDLQVKLPFLIFPLILGAGTMLKKRWLEGVFCSFIISLFLITIFCLVRAYFRYQETHYLPVFFYHMLVDTYFEANAVYMAWYAFFALALLLFFPWERMLRHKGLKILAIIVISAFLVLLSSRMVLAVFLVVLIPTYLVKTFFTGRISNVYIALMAIGALLLAGGVIFTDNPVKKRFTDIFKGNIEEAWTKDYHNFEQKNFTNLTTRIFLWRIGIENMNEHGLWLTGAGNGDVRHLQNDKIREYHIIPGTAPTDTSLENANLHNMPMQILIMLGIPGVIMLMIILLTPFFYIKSFSYKFSFFFFFLISFLFNMQEAAIQTQAGIVYYLFFTSIFWNIYYADNKRLA